MKRIVFVVAMIVMVMGMGFGLCPPAYADDPVRTFPDPNLDTAMHDNTGVPYGNDIHQSDLDALTDNIHLEGYGIQDLTGMEYCTNAKQIVAHDNDISDLSPISGLTGLLNLDVSGNNLSDLTHIGNLVSLEGLHIEHDHVTS